MGTVALLAMMAMVAASGSQDAPSQPTVSSFLLKDARVVVRPGQVLNRADVLIKDGKIVSVGVNLAKPEGAEVLDCSGLTAYPGLIHPFLRANVDGIVPSTQGLTPQQLMERRDADPRGAIANLLCRTSTAELTQKEVAAFTSLSRSGFTLAHVSANGGLLGPTSAVYALSGKDLEPGAVVAKPEFVPLQFSGRGFGGGYPGSTMGGIAVVRQALYDAQRYLRLKNANSKQEENPGLEALSRVAAGQTRAVFDDLSELSFFQSRAITKEFGLKPVYSFRNGAGAVSDLLKESDVAVILKDEIPARPRIGDNLDAVSLASVRNYFNQVQAAAELQRQRIEFSYAPASLAEPLAGIRTYVQAGLDRDTALAAMTLRPAKLLGIESQVGTLESGKMANVLVTQGDLFDSSSQIMAVFSNGKRLDMPMPPRKKAEDLKADPKLALMPPNYAPFPAPAETKPAFRLYRNATVWTLGPQGTITGADLLIRDGKIVQVGRGIRPPQGCEVVDATGKHISPGIWDCHSHTGIDGGVNEGSNMITVECRIGDVINHRAIGIYRQLSGGTVGANQLHGSANAIGGQSSTVKWRWGERPTEFPVKGAVPGVKFALGENPMRQDQGRGGAGAQQQTPEGTTLLTWRPRTRMGVEEAIRRALQLGKEYAIEWDAYRQGKTAVEPRRDLQLEGLAEIVTGKRVIHSHGYRQDELLMLLRVAKEYGARINTFQHVLEGYKIADEMAAEGVAGSTFADWWGYKLEAYDAIPYNAALMAQRGVSVSVNSDSDNHARRLNHEAAKSIRYGGVSPEVALSFVTREPARQLGIEKWTGTLEPGKDADFAVWTADPTSIYAVCWETYVDGVKRFDRENDAKQRQQRIAELERAKKLLSGDSSEGNPFVTGAEAAGPASADGPGASTAKFGLGPVKGEPGTMRYPRTAVLIAGATVHPMASDPFVGDVLIGANGKIQAVGQNLSAPSGATPVDGRGKHLYPGLIDPATSLGINEIGQVPVSDDSSERGDFHPDYRVERVINGEWETLAVARQQGVLTAIVKPGGAGFAGQAALIHTDGYTWEDYTVQGGIALAVSAGGGGFFGGDGHEDDGDLLAGVQGRRGQGSGPNPTAALDRLSARLQETREYLKKRAEANGTLVPVDLRYEALSAALDGSLPFLVSANSATEIRAAVAWAEKENVRVLLYGCSGAGEIAEWLAEKQVPIVLAAVFGMPEADRPTDFFYGLPARLKRAGVKFCLTTNDAHNVRQLRDQAGFAAAFGLDREDAVRSITLWTAEMLGIADRLGAIKPGMDGTLILTDGDILETRTQVLRAWIAGRECDLTNKQTRLYDKYRTRPKP